MKSNESILIRNIDVALARAFVATAETGGMTAAARLLNLTQGAVSQQIKRLEELLQRQLFDRKHKELSLTPDGERLLLHARRLISLNDEIWGVMSQPDFEGEVRLGIPSDVVRSYMPAVLRSFNQAWPKVRINLVCGNSPYLRKQLAEGMVDLTLTTEVDTPSGAESLLTEDLLWIGAPGGTAFREDPVPIAITDSDCTFRAKMIEVLERAGRDWRLIGPLKNNDALLATVEADIGISSLLRSAIPAEVQILGPESGLPSLVPYHVNLYQRTSASGGVADELARHIRDQFERRFAAGRRPHRMAG